MNKRLKITAHRPPKSTAHNQLIVKTLLFSSALVTGAWSAQSLSAIVTAPIAGEIEKITLDNPNDHWSGGMIVAGGQNIVIPKNLLIDLPANRLTLQEIFQQASASCKTQQESGLAKGDACNASGTGAIATINANRLENGHVIAGDVFIQKAAETVTGQITYISYDQGYFRVNGKVGDPATGVMIRLNDPEKRHTIQSGTGCAASSANVNCSPDPRFTLDGDNYTNVYSTGYPLCIPSRVLRSFTDFAVNPVGAGAVSSVAQADGTGDLLCPTSNRTTDNLVADSRRFAPIMLGDSITAEGNYEEVNGTRFLSAHSTMVSVALATRSGPGAEDQPDYFFLDEVEVDVPGFQNRRARSLIIGYSTLPPDIMIWSIHYDPETNSPHEFPLASTAGCDIAAGPLTCTGQGLATGAGAGGNIFKIRHDVDFITPTKPRWDPCAHLKADTRFPSSICPSTVVDTTQRVTNTNWEEQFAILSPIPHEIQARTGRKFADMTSGSPEVLKTIDIMGNEATNGQYLFPFGMGLGGVSTPEMVEIDLNALQTPISFSGIPWNLDRRLGPGGCVDSNNDGVVECESTPQPLEPFPFEGTNMDPRSLSTIPSGSYNDPNFIAGGSLNNVQDRILSYVKLTALRPGGNGIGVNADGNFTTAILDWSTHSSTHATPPSTGPGSGDVSSSPILPQAMICSANSAFNSPPVATDDAATTQASVSTTISVLWNDSDVNGDTLTVTGVSSSVNPIVGTSTTTSQGGTADLNLDGTISFTPAPGFSGVDTFIYTITDGTASVTGTVSVTVQATSNDPPVANADSITLNEDSGSTVIDALLNDTDTNSGTGSSVLSIASVTSPIHGTVSITGNPALDKDQKINYTPSPNFNGVDTFDYIVVDGQGGSATGTVNITVLPVNDAPVALGETATVVQGTSMTINVLNNDSDIDADSLSISSLNSTPISVPMSAPIPTSLGAITTEGATVSYAANPGVTGVDTFTYTVTDMGGLTATATVTVNVIAPIVDILGVTRAQFTRQSSEWRVEGTGSVPGKTITVRLGTTNTGGIIGTAIVDTLGAWIVRVKPGIQPTSATTQITAWSSGNGKLSSSFTIK